MRPYLVGESSLRPASRATAAARHRARHSGETVTIARYQCGIGGQQCEGDRIGMTSSGGYGHRVEKSIALGYVASEFAAVGTKMEVEILGRARSAEVVAMPLYDPKNEKMKS